VPKRKSRHRLLGREACADAPTADPRKLGDENTGQLAHARVCSGAFERGDVLTHAATDAEFVAKHVSAGVLTRTDGVMLVLFSTRWRPEGFQRDNPDVKLGSLAAQETAAASSA
jgi:hypothetical protein